MSLTRAVGVPRCDGVDDLPVGENIAVPMEMGLQIPGCLGDAGADDERQPSSSRASRLAAESIPASAATTIGVPSRLWRAGKLVMIGTIVVVSAVLPSKQPISKGNPGAVHQQSDDNLRIDPAFLGVADLAQLVFVFGLEIQRGDVVQQQATDRRSHVHVVKAFRGDHITIAGRRGSCGHGGQSSCRTPRLPQISQHPQRVGLAGRLDDPGDHQIPEHRIADPSNPSQSYTWPSTS